MNTDKQEIDVLDLLDYGNYITLNKDIINKFGLFEAIMIGELAGKYRYWKTAGKLTDDGYFFISREDIEKETSLSPHIQRKALEHLKDLGVVDYYIDNTSMIHSNYYKLNGNAIIDARTLTTLTPERKPGEHPNVNHVNTTKRINTKRSYKKRTDSSSSSEEVAINNDQSAITNYINKLNYNPSTISVLLKWYDLVAKDRGLTIKQLKYNINSINESTNGNEYEISKAINEAIDNDWMGFYKSQKKEPAYKRLSKQNVYEEEIRKPVILGTEVF